MPINTSIPAAPQGPDQTAEPTPAENEMSPVVEALKTIQTWIAAVGQKDPSKAQALGSAFQGFVSSLKSGATPEAPKGPAAPEAPAGPTETPPAGQESQAPSPDQGAMGGGGKRPVPRPMPMNAKKGAVPILLLLLTLGCLMGQHLV